jgi:filamentous hemagglutinin family protein
MRPTNSLHLLVVGILLGLRTALGVPTTTITPNGLGTTVVPPTSGFYNIQGGTVAGNNLFHSFSTFNLGTGDTADFNVSGNIANILARVTGGPSTIDGTITSTVGAGGPLSNANLFFINPAGVMFTANAQVNLGGSFTVSTADYVKFSDGSIFYSDVNHPIQDAGLTTAPVSAFGFLSPTPSAISFDGSQIRQPVDTGLHVIGGNLAVNDAYLLAPGGALTLFSAASAGEVPFSLASPGTGFANTSVTSFGSINVTNGSKVEIDYRGGGSVVIRGGQLTVDQSDITSGNYGSIPGGNISVQVDSLTLSNAGYIEAVSETLAFAMFNTGNLPIITGDTGSANCGSVTVNVTGNAAITGSGSEIDADTFTAGAGGTVTVVAGGQIDMANGGSIFAASYGTGNAGAVNVQAAGMTMSSGTEISTATNGVGNAGQITLNLSGPLTLSGNANILADTYAGNGGNIQLQASLVSMADQSLISANTFAGGPGGDINIETGSFSIHGDGGYVPPGSLGVTAQTFGSGNGGTITLTTGSLSLNQGGIFSSSYFGSGNAGVIRINSGNLALSDGATVASSSFGAGSGGTVSVDCAQGSLDGQSTLTASSTFTNAGSVQVTADSLTLSSGSVISTSAGDNGGDITLHVGQLLYLTDSNIQAYAGVVSTPGQQAGGTGGDIGIDPLFVVLDNSLISANELSGIGQDGNITNTANYFFTSDSILHATGTIETTPPDLDLAGSLAFLPANLVSAENRLRESCAQSVNHEFSTLILVGRGGIESAPEELRADFGQRPDVGASRR